MSYTTAQALLEDLLGGVKDATALETYLATPGNRGVLDFLMSDEILGPTLFSDEPAVQSVRDSATASSQLLNNAAAMNNFTNSRSAMILAALSSTFMNAMALKGRAILAFVKSPYVRDAAQSGTGYTNLSNAQAQGGSKLKRTQFLTNQSGGVTLQTWTRPASLIWAYVLCIGSGAGGYAVSYLHWGTSGQVVGKIFEGSNLPVGNQSIYVGDSGLTQDGYPSIFGLVNVSLNSPGYLTPDYVLSLVRAEGGYNPAYTSASWSSSGKRILGAPFGKDYNLFSKMANAPMQDRELNMWVSPFSALDDVSGVGNYQGGACSPIGLYNASTATLGGTGGNLGVPATGYGAAGSSNGSGVFYAAAPGTVIVWSIEE